MVRRFVRLVGVAALIAASVGMAAVAPAAADGNEAPGNPVAFRSLSAGREHTCGILSNTTVRCWGNNSFGQLGLGDTAPRGDNPNEMGAFLPAVALGTARTATALTTGGAHSCALLDNGTVKCWGLNTNGQLGLGDVAARGDGPNEMGDNLPAVNLGTGRTAIAITAGGAHTCALLDNHSVKCWGQGTFGALGLGDVTSRGDGASEMGDNLPTVNLGTGRTATAISAGTATTCALLDNSAVKCWGSNNIGQLGLGDAVDRGNAANQMGDNLPTVNLGTGRTATAISTSYVHTCALLDNSSLKCWGDNFFGELGLGDTTARGNDANEMGNSLPAINVGTGRTVTAISTGDFDTCARLDNNTVKCWGYNAFGQLGQGDTAPRGDGPGEMGNSLPAINLGTGRTAIAISAGAYFTCASLDNGKVKCWGTNGSAVLGLEDLAARGDAPNQMGDNLPVVSLPPAGVLSGTVTDSISNQPISTAQVVALRTSDFSLVAAATTDGSGNYAVSAPPGSYFLYLLDASGGHPEGFYGSPGATTVVVTDGATTDTDPTLVPRRGSFSGTLTDQGTGLPVVSALVYAIGNSGIVAGTTTSASGTYTIANLPVGNYHAVFIDGLGHRNLEYYDNSPDFAGSISIAVTGGNNTTNINAALLRP